MLLDVLKILTEDGGNQYWLGADFTLFGSHLGSNFMALTSQVSFGHDLRKFTSSEHFHLHAELVEIQHMIHTWE